MPDAPLSFIPCIICASFSSASWGERVRPAVTVSALSTLVSSNAALIRAAVLAPAFFLPFRGGILLCKCRGLFQLVQELTSSGT